MPQLSVARKILLAALFVSISTIVNAMGAPVVGGAPPAGAPPAGNGAPCWSPPCIPIDGGLFFLLTGGVFLGVRKIMQETKKQKQV